MRWLIINISKIIFLFLMVTTAGCEKSAERRYQEIIIESSRKKIAGMENSEVLLSGNGLDMPLADNTKKINPDIAWDVPDGWRQEAAGGMRVATFKLISDPDLIDVSIVVLGGQAGGVQANLDRWAKQIDINLSQQQLKEFIEGAEIILTKRGIEGKIFDFAIFQQSQNPSTPGLLAAMVPLGDQTLFVKMTGDKRSVESNKVLFVQLVRSIR